MDRPLQLIVLGCSQVDSPAFVDELSRAGFAPECRQIMTEAQYIAALATPVDIILADDDYPALGPLRALEILRLHAPDLPLIVLTTLAGEGRAGEWIRLGAADYLFKDRPARLGLAVARAIEFRQMRAGPRPAGGSHRADQPAAHAVLDALAAHIAVLDETGTIVAVNRAWSDFARAGGDPDLAHTGVGMNYLAVCRAAIGARGAEAGPALKGIMSVMAGEREHFEIEYPCPTPTEKHWFALKVTPLAGDWRGVVVAHYDVTARKQTELSLRESEQRFRTLFESSPDAIILIDPHDSDVSWPIVDCNDVACQMNGYSREELIGQSIDLLHRQAADPDDRAGYFAKLRRDGRIYSEAIHYRKDNRPVWIESSSSLISIHGRELVLGIDRDVTDLKATQEALRETEERFRSAYENAPIGMAIVYLDGRWLQVNRALTDIIGYTEQELRATTFQALTHPDDLELDLRLVDDILAGKIRSYQMEKRYFHKDGRVITVLLSVALVRDIAGQPLYFISQIQDISERKRTEEALHRAETRYRTLVEQLPVIIYTAEINAESSTNYVSPQIETILGFSPAEWLANPNLWIEQVHHDDREIVLAAVQQAQASDAPVPLEYRSYTRGGEVVWLHDAARVVRDEYGRALFLQGVTLDITERKRIEHALIEERALLAQRVAERTADLSVANAELARAAQLKDEFLASMSHELRTPLNAVLGLSEALQEQVYGPLNERQQAALHNITTSGQHLLDLINDILDLAKIGAGKLALDLEPTPIAHVCEASMRIVRPLAEKKGQSLSMSIDPAVRVVSADPRRLKQALVNLLSNAIKFTPEGGAIGLEVAGDRARQAVDISIWDTGIGIAPDHLAQLFQPFVQLDRRLARQYSGTGLGLSLVARMVALHGGGVAVSSTVGSGSRFTVALPWQEADLGGARLPSPNGSSHLAAGAAHPAIVLADDDETSSAIVSEHLRRAGCQVIIARNGAEAIARVREAQPALAIISLQLQGMPGIELTRRLRTDDALPKLPIIVLNGRALPGDRERCLAAGSDRYLTKPVGRHLLLTTVEALLHRVPSYSAIQ